MVADAVTRLFEKCCTSHCVGGTMARPELEEFVRECLKEVIGKNRAKKKAYMVKKVESCVVNRRGKNFQYRFRAGTPSVKEIEPVCAKAFQICYDCNHEYINQCARAVSSAMKFYFNN